MQLILYSKLGCHLCEGLLAKLQQVRDIALEIEIRDITQQSKWFDDYQYEIPVLYLKIGEKEQKLPRLSPRTPVSQWQKQLQAWAIEYKIPLDGT
jgi:hypothetical protein